MDVYDGDLSFSTVKTSSNVLIFARSRERFSTVFSLWRMTRDTLLVSSVWLTWQPCTLLQLCHERQKRIRHASKLRAEPDRTGTRGVTFDACGSWNVLNVIRHLKEKDQRSWRDEFRQFKIFDSWFSIYYANNFKRGPTRGFVLKHKGKINWCKISRRPLLEKKKDNPSFEIDNLSLFIYLALSVCQKILELASGVVNVLSNEHRSVRASFPWDDTLIILQKCELHKLSQAATSSVVPVVSAPSI